MKKLFIAIAAMTCIAQAMASGDANTNGVDWTQLHVIHGQGGMKTIHFPNGNVCTGMFDENYKPIGDVKVVTNTGLIYLGEINEKFEYHGKGRLELPGGDVYEGDFNNGLKKGNGMYTSAKGDKYEGPYKDDRPYGEGVITDLCGHVYDILIGAVKYITGKDGVKLEKPIQWPK